MMGDRQADRVVPPTGLTVWLTVLTAGAMAFLAVFALSLTLAMGRLASHWSDGTAQSLTIRITAPAADAQQQEDAVMAILVTTPGIAAATPLSREAQGALLEPWLGPDLPVDRLPLPRLIDVTQDPDSLDIQGLRLHLAAEVPNAVLDDHTAWRRPMVDAAGRLRMFGWMALLLIATVLGTMVTLAAQAALAASSDVIRVLRLVGARDTFVARAFTRRFTLRSLAGAAGGTVLGMLALLTLPTGDVAQGLLLGIRPVGASWLLLPLVPLFAGTLAFAATRRAAFRALRRFE